MSDEQNQAIEEPWNQKKTKAANFLGRENKNGSRVTNVGGINSSFEGHLFNAPDPCTQWRWQVIRKEKPIHRLMQVMASKGFNHEEIAKETGYTVDRVQTILRQPWAQMNIVDSVKRSVQDEIKDFLESEVLPSLQFLKDLRADPDAPKAVRLAASNSILDRFLGKPNQPISTQNVDPTKLTSQELERRVTTLVAGMAETSGDS